MEGSSNKPKKRVSSQSTKMKAKMTKAQMELALKKKKETDYKALKIVERLIEPDIDSEWLLNNLKHINKCHMEDIIEERALSKLCGYVLCKTLITQIKTQKYSISLKHNKVYDITKRKNFCSSNCYGAANYLIEQMLSSPLWLRDKEDIPIFKILSNDQLKSNKCHGDEIIVKSNEFFETNDNIKDFNFKSTLEITKKDENSDMMKNEPDLVKNINIKSKKLITIPDDDLRFIVNNRENLIAENKNKDELKNEQFTKIENQCDCVNEKTNEQDLKNLTTGTLNQKISQTIKNKEKNKTVNKTTITKHNLLTSNDLISRIEKCLNEWVTNNTKLLLFGEHAEKEKTIENSRIQAASENLYEKLSRLKIQEEYSEQCTIEKTELKPAPDFQTLKEDSKQLQIKVRAFYKGETVIQGFKESETDKNKEHEDSEPYLPIMESLTPNNILRKKIFLNKLNKILPDLVQILTVNNPKFQKNNYNYTYENSESIRDLINTFSLTASNIVFKTVEWTLVGLIIIKMLSLLDPWLKTLLESREAKIYISMILTEYKLSLNYLDSLVNNINTSKNY